MDKKATNQGFLTRTANALFASPGIMALTGLGIALVAGAAIGMTDAGADWMLESHPFDVLPRSLAPVATAMFFGAAAAVGGSTLLLATGIGRELGQQRTHETTEQASKKPADPAP